MVAACPAQEHGPAAQATKKDRPPRKRYGCYLPALALAVTRRPERGWLNLPAMGAGPDHYGRNDNLNHAGRARDLPPSLFALRGLENTQIPPWRPVVRTHRRGGKLPHFCPDGKREFLRIARGLLPGSGVVGCRHGR